MTRQPWRNAQHRDRPEMSQAQTGFYDTKRGWADRPFVRKCRNLAGLEPGTYPVTIGESITAGGSGSVVYNGKIYQAKNQCSCAVTFGTNATLHVSPNCEAFFVPCDCNESEPVDCCDKSIAICIAGTTHVLRDVSLDPGYKEWGICCLNGGVQEVIYGYVDCNAGADGFIFNWVSSSIPGGGLTPLYGTVDLGGVCTGGSASGTMDLTAIGCGVVDVYASLDLITCEDCTGSTPPLPEDCCSKSLYFCLNGVSQLLAVDGGNYTWDVSACCDATASLEITLSCTSSPDNISMSWTYTAGVVTESGVENTLMSQFCVDDTPRIITFTNSPCFLQMVASISDLGCAECVSGESPPTTSAPPP